MRVDFQLYKNSQISSFKTPLRGVRVLSEPKYDVVSFGNQKDLISLPANDIIESVEKSIKPVNLLGKGGEATVYQIEGADYCVRVPHFMPNDYKKGFISELTDLERVNHGVAKLGEKTIIMKILDGYSMFPRRETGVTRTMVHSMIDEMPVSAYRQVLKQIAEAHEKGAYFDSTGANVIVNPIKRTMTIIDFTDCIECSNSRFLKSLFITLGLSDGLLTKAQQTDRANKILSSVIDDFLPGNKPMMRIADYCFPDFIHAVKGQGLISKSYADVFINNLKELEELKYKELRGVKGCENQMIFRVKVVKSLIKQLLT